MNHWTLHSLGWLAVSSVLTAFLLMTAFVSSASRGRPDLRHWFVSRSLFVCGWVCLLLAAAARVSVYLVKAVGW